MVCWWNIQLRQSTSRDSNLLISCHLILILQSEEYLAHFAQQTFKLITFVSPFPGFFASSPATCFHGMEITEIFD